MPLIPEEIIDDIQSRMDIAEVIGRYVPLQRAGRHFKARCPFHKERTPSFMVNTDKQIFHCFGCGIGGNVFSFLMQHDRLTFPEAVRQVADQVGVRIPDRGTQTKNGAAETLLPLMEKVCRYFERVLQDAHTGKDARAYLEQRGVSERTRQAFRLGVAPAGWDGLLKAARATGVSPERLEAAGLVIQGAHGYYDRFRHRLMFPIMDVRGRVVGLGGRSLDGQEPKYLNSPETPLYVKGRQLFGLAQAKEAIVSAKTAVLVEGYFDCVVLAEWGIANVVSPLGTALTADQAKLLKRYAEQVILAFDADAAGEQATLRGIDVLVESGLQVRVAQLPPNVDPDEYVRASGREGFQQLVSQSLGIFDCLVQTALRRFPGRVSRSGAAATAAATEDKVQAAQFVLPTIAKTPNAMLRREYVRLLAERLQLDEAAVAEELRKVQPRSTPASRPAAGSLKPVPRGAAQGPERLFTALVLDEPSRWIRGEHGLALEAIADPMLRRILAVVGELGAARSAVIPAHVVSRLADPAEGALVSELVELARSMESPEEAFRDCLRRLQTNARKRELAALREQIRLAQETGQDADAERLLAEYQRQLSAMPGATPARLAAVLQGAGGETG